MMCSRLSGLHEGRFSTDGLESLLHEDCPCAGPTEGLLIGVSEWLPIEHSFHFENFSEMSRNPAN